MAKSITPPPKTPKIDRDVGGVEGLYLMTDAFWRREKSLFLNDAFFPTAVSWFGGISPTKTNIDQGKMSLGASIPEPFLTADAIDTVV